MNAQLSDSGIIAVITGDVINSKRMPATVWLPHLKQILREWGREPKAWQIYRGDSFQLEIPSVLDSLEAAVLIKAGMKTVKGLDVRLAIGIGEKSYAGSKVTESNGEAFVYSGQVFDRLKKHKVNMVVKSPWDEFDEEINVMLRLALTFMDRWLVNHAEVIALSLRHKALSQKQLGSKLNIAQNTVSDRLARAHREELLEMLGLFRKKLLRCMA
ncbi:MAG: transcriptional regulator [Candidatus Thiodiazotropha sp.]